MLNVLESHTKESLLCRKTGVLEEFVSRRCGLTCVWRKSLKKEQDEGRRN